MRTFILLSLLFTTTALYAQPSHSIPPGDLALPAGTILPVSLDSTLHADHAHPGQRVQATVMQSIPGTAVHRGARLIGQVVEAESGPDPRLTLRFTMLRLRHSTIPVQVSLRAMASLLEVEEAETPEDMATRGTVPQNATTRQIGGQQVYRGGGPVAEGMTPVGTPVAYGILALPLTRPGQSCRAQVADDLTPQAFWLFSSDACGLFGYNKLRIEHAGRSAPSGLIVFTATRGHKLTLQSGSGMLLRVLPVAQTSAQSADSVSLAAMSISSPLLTISAR